MRANTSMFRSVLLAVLAGSLAGCSSLSVTQRASGNKATIQTTTTAISTSSSNAVASGNGSVLPVVASENGWSASGLEGKIPPAGACHYRYFGKWVLPDPKCTPGSITPLVTSSNPSSTICRRGYSASVRPPVSLTEPAKYALMRAYGLTGSPSRYEFDHLIPLELGGSSNLANLWPEPNQGTPSELNPYSHYGLNAKDGVESQSNYAVCDKGYPLALAQQEMAQNWVLANQKMPN